MRPTAEALRSLLDDARRQLAAGDAAEAERHARAVSAILRAEGDIAQFIAAAEPDDPEKDAELVRAELRSRFRRLVEAEHGYVVDAPATARAALEPLMAAYDLDAAERDGRIVFFHRAGGPPTGIPVAELAAEAAGAAFAQRGDPADTPIEARVRFLDAARDYLIAGVNARRLDRADGGVLTIEAPLVLETDQAEGLAQRALASVRAATETLRIAVGPAHLALEPGDAVRLSDGPDAFEIVRTEDAETRRLELRRTRAGAAASLDIGEPHGPVVTPTAPTPALSILDLPALPGAEDDERPLAAVFASPWLGPHAIHAGAALTRRATASDAALMGELLWPLPAGPVDRWDDGNLARVRLYGGALTSAAREAVLDGANAFAIEADGEFEIVQARNCVLVAPSEYELSGLLRGRLGSTHAMRSPHPAGARVIRLDARLARVDIGAHEWGEALAFAAPPFAAAASDPRTQWLTATLPHAALRPWAPAQVRARRVSGGAVEIGWVRCARLAGDAWGPGEPPLGAAAERYLLEILDGGAVVRALTLSTPVFTYGSSEQLADFGVLPASLRIRVAQLNDAEAPGLNTELTITL